MIVIYTDGSCKGNPGPGGWAAIITNDKNKLIRSRIIRGGAALTTNNRMELTAIIRGLQIMLRAATVEIRTDSRYVVDTMTRGNRRLKNLDLWSELDLCLRDRTVIWTWIKGHSGDPGNEHADRLAQEEAERWRSTTD